MPISQYSWKNGPDVIQQHSIAKHHILESYLAAYFQTLVGGQPRDEFRLTLVDGFAGGGLYTHADTGELIKGSPLILLQAEREAEFLINQGRTKPVRLDVSHFFIEAARDAYLHLDRTLRSEGYGARIGESIHLRHAKFEDEANGIIDYIKKKSPRNGRSIFVLDQFGYSAVPTSLINKILHTLPGAEIILTFAVDSFLNYANEKNFTHGLKQIELPNVLAGRSLREIKASERDWRLYIQASLYKELVGHCGAKHYTPFFVRNKKGHGDYWLIHLSQHHRARDVMTRVHWRNQNYFIHYGGAGLNMFDMLGYDPDHDSAHQRQGVLGFEFDAVAKNSSIAALMDQVPRVIYAHEEGVNYDVLFATTCNESPASSEIYQEALIQLANHRVIEIVGADGEKRKPSRQLKATDQIMAPSQRSLFF
jgi:three-Cys-motif partner protein